MKPLNLIFPKLNYELETLLHHQNRYKFARQFLTESDSVLDLGCGTGYGCNIMKMACKNIFGVDCDEPSIESAIRNYNFHIFPRTFICKSLEETQLKHTVITMFETLEHLSVKNGRAILNKISNSEVKLFFASVPKDSELGKNPHHKSQWNEEEVRKYLKMDRVMFFGQDWSSGLIQYPFSKQHSMLIVMGVNG